MGSASLKYGRKGSLLRSLGSRRRQKATSDEEQPQNEPSNELMASSESPVSVAIDSTRNSFDQLASALLSSATPSEKRRAHPVDGLTRPLRDIASPPSPSSRCEQRKASLPKSPARRTMRSYSKMSPSKLRPSTSSRLSTNPSALRDTALWQPFSMKQPTDWNPLGLHPSGDFAGPQHFKSRPSNTSDRQKGSQGMLLEVNDTNILAVDQEVDHRLVESTALQSTRQDRPPFAHKPQRRGTGRVLFKVTQAFERLHTQTSGSSWDA